MACRDQALPSLEDWRRLLEEAPEASVYHTPEFHRALGQAGLATHVVSSRRQGELRGLAVVLLDRLFPLPVLGRKAFAPAGLLALDDQAREDLQRQLDKALKGRCLYFEQYVEGRAQDSFFADLGLRTDRHRNFLVDLDRPWEELEAAFSRGIRRNIRHAEERGFTWRLAHGAQELHRVHDLLLETSRRVAAPPLPWALLRAVNHNLVPAGMCRIYVAEAPGGAIVNTRIELVHGQRAIDWFTGTDMDWVDSQVGSWLVGRILQDLHSRGVCVLDFGGAGRVGESYGPAEFKRRFGGREVDISRHLRIYHPRLTRLARRGWRLLRGA
jgi:hypothetical protein